MTQESDDIDVVRRTCRAWVLRGSFGSLQIMPKSESCLKCRRAVAGSEPATKLTKEEGELAESLRMF